MKGLDIGNTSKTTYLFCTHACLQTISGHSVCNWLDVFWNPPLISWGLQRYCHCEVVLCVFKKNRYKHLEMQIFSWWMHISECPWTLVSQCLRPESCRSPNRVQAVAALSTKSGGGKKPIKKVNQGSLSSTCVCRLVSVIEVQAWLISFGLFHKKKHKHSLWKEGFGLWHSSPLWPSTGLHQLLPCFQIWPLSPFFFTRLPQSI